MSQIILNLTQHSATPEQIASGVRNPGSEKDRQEIVKLLTFDEPPTIEEMTDRAEGLAKMARDEYRVASAMIGGAPFFMGVLETALKNHGIAPVYAFSKRESVDQKLEDGTVIKVSVFKHVGFVEV